MPHDVGDTVVGRDSETADPASFVDAYNDLPQRLNESVARIESLKIKVLGWPGANDGLRSQFFTELDSLRGAFLQLAQATLQAKAVVATPKPARPLPPEPSVLKFEGIVGQSPRIGNILRIISRVARRDLTVLLEGETGTGKELFARIIHNNSQRENFVAVNCGAFPSGLIESELFGHVKGAFTGASHERKGAFEEANGGTIFLDEIGELELLAQVKLLRVLESGDIQRVGSDADIKTDVRVIAATNRDLSAMVRDGLFREDLYYRLNVCPISIPALRERRDEVPILLDYFLQQICNRTGQRTPVMNKSLRTFLYKEYHFPGNIRELRNIAQYLAMMDSGEPLGLDDLPAPYQEARKAANATGAHLTLADAPLDEVRREAERRQLEDVVLRHRGNMLRICAELKLSRSRAYQLFKKHQINPGEYR